MDINELRINAETSENGLWIDYYGGQICIARIGSKAFSEKQREGMDYIFEKYADDKSKITKELLIEIDTKALATCITGWKGFTQTSKAGKKTEYKYSKKAAEKMLLDPEFGDVKDFIWNQASLRENYKINKDNTLKKN